MARSSSLFLLLGSLAMVSALAAPPAPTFTIYGSVRTESGRPLSSGEATLIVSVAGAEITRGPTDAALGRGINYTLQMPMDAGFGATPYRSDALVYKATTAPAFVIQAVIGAKTYVPITVAGHRLGEPAARERLDLILGIDEDNDGLPDSWEQGLIDADASGDLNNLADVTRDGDADGDGLTNYQEFLAGTYALDATNNVFIDVAGVNNGVARLQFVAARGRTYSVQSSADLKTWLPQSISLNPSGAEAGLHYRAEDSEVVDIYAPGTASKPAKFFRLYVE